MNTSRAGSPGAAVGPYSGPSIARGKPMPAYIIAMMTVTKPDAYEGYRTLAGAAVARHGGRFLARGGKHEVLEGAFPGKRVVILEFENYAKAKAFYDSPEYLPAREQRRGAAEFNLLIVDGA